MPSTRPHRSVPKLVSLGPVSQAQGGHQTAHPAGLERSSPHRHPDTEGKCKDVDLLDSLVIESVAFT